MGAPLALERVVVENMFIKFARVAQLDRVTASEAEGCGFNSRRAHHFPPPGARH
jgi:hypothetical protein